MLILSFLPLLLFVVPAMMHLDFILKLVICLLSPIGGVVLVTAGLLPFRVVVDDECVRAAAVLKSTSVSWLQVRRMRLVSKWGFRVYELLDADDQCQVFFPLWFKNMADLVETTRGRLPSRGLLAAPGVRVFKQDVAVLIIQILKSCGQLAFLTVFWCFSVSYAKSSGSHAEDLVILYGAATIFSAMAIWKLYLLLTVPFEVTIDGSTIRCRGPLGENLVQTGEIRGISPSNFLQPEGIVVDAVSKKVLLAAFLESFDELEETLRGTARIG